MRHLDRLEAELASTTAAVAELRALIERPQQSGAVEHRTVPARAAIAIQATVDREDMLDWWQGALGELHAIASAQRLEPAGPPGGMYASEIFQHGRGRATVFIPTDAPPRAVGRVEPLAVPQAELAVMTHHGSLADGDLTYGELGAHVMRHEISVDGPLREYYLVGFLDAPDPRRGKPRSGGRSSVLIPDPQGPPGRRPNSRSEPTCTDLSQPQSPSQTIVTATVEATRISTIEGSDASGDGTLVRHHLTVAEPGPTGNDALRRVCLCMATALEAASSAVWQPADVRWAPGRSRSGMAFAWGSRSGWVFRVRLTRGRRLSTRQGLRLGSGSGR